MHRNRNFLSLFWAVAILLLVTAQVTHVYSDHWEPNCHAHHSDSDHDHSDATGTESTETHHCCHAHSPVNSVYSDSTGLMFPHLVCGNLAEIADSLPEPPVQEIDYPPQVS